MQVGLGIPAHSLLAPGGKEANAVVIAQGVGRDVELFGYVTN